MYTIRLPHELTELKREFTPISDRDICFNSPVNTQGRRPGVKENSHWGHKHCTRHTIAMNAVHKRRESLKNRTLENSNPYMVPYLSQVVHPLPTAPQQHSSNTTEDSTSEENIASHRDHIVPMRGRVS